MVAACFSRAPLISGQLVFFSGMRPFSLPLALNLQQEEKLHTSHSVSFLSRLSVSGEHYKREKAVTSSNLALAVGFHMHRSAIFFVLLNSVDNEIGAANDYRTFNLQLTKERSWLITSYSVQQPVLQALRYVGLHWEDGSVG